MSPSTILHYSSSLPSPSSLPCLTLIHIPPSLNRLSQNILSQLPVQLLNLHHTEFSHSSLSLSTPLPLPSLFYKPFITHLRPHSSSLVTVFCLSLTSISTIFHLTPTIHLYSTTDNFLLSPPPPTLMLLLSPRSLCFFYV